MKENISKLDHSLQQFYLILWILGLALKGLGIYISILLIQDFAYQDIEWDTLVKFLMIVLLAKMVTHCINKRKTLIEQLTAIGSFKKS